MNLGLRCDGRWRKLGIVQNLTGYRPVSIETTCMVVAIDMANVSATRQHEGTSADGKVIETKLLTRIEEERSLR